MEKETKNKAMLSGNPSRIDMLRQLALVRDIQALKDVDLVQA